MSLNSIVGSVKDRQQEAERHFTTVQYSVALIYTISSHISNDSLCFCLSNHINDVMINLWKLLILNQFFYFYSLNKDTLLGICFPKMKFCIVGHKILLERRVSHFFDGLGCFFR